MKQQRKILIGIMLAAAVFLSGCVVSYEPAQPLTKSSEREDRPQGSANTLEGESVLVSIYINDEDDPWTEGAYAYTERALDIAANWIEEQGAAYDKEVTLIYNDGDDEDLVYELDNERLERLSKKDDSSAYAGELERFIDTIPDDEIKEKYHTDSIGYLVFFNTEGYSFAYPYVDGSYFGYDETATIYLYDEDSYEGEYETPAVYAHEILHIFGAADLYEENEEDHISEEIVSYVEENYPKEIMYSTYEPDNTSNFSEINKEISGITAYGIGFSDHVKELDLFPELVRDNKCAFEGN